MLARRTKIKVIFKNIDISEYVVSLSYTDNTDFTDDLSITLSNRERFWEGEFFPETGDLIYAEIYMLNWDGENDYKIFKLGVFEIDSIGYNVTDVTVNAVSAFVSAALRSEKKYKIWENVNLSVIGKDIAKNAGFKFVYDTDFDPKYDKEEQSNESDLSFLENLCKAEGFALKVSNGQIIIFDESKYDTFEPVAEIKAGTSYLYGYPKFQKNIKNIYTACEITYFDSKTDKMYVENFSAPNDTGKGQVLKLHERFNSESEIINYGRKAKARLREQNKNEQTCSVSLKGDFYFAGTNVLMTGFYKFDGKYNISSCKHSVSRNGYVVDLSLRRCLEGY